MTQFYLDESKANDKWSLPDVWVTWLDWQPGDKGNCSMCGNHAELHETWEESECEECFESAYYYAFCMPGCLPDSDFYGPFKTEQDAMKDCRDIHLN